MKKLIAVLTVATLGMAAAQAGVHVGISIGLPAPGVFVAAPAPVVVAPAPVVVAPAPVVVQPPMPAPVVEVVPTCPTPGYIWVGGSWGWCDNHWVWRRGYWGAPAHWGYGYHGGYYGGYHGAYHWGHGRRSRLTPG